MFKFVVVILAIFAYYTFADIGVVPPVKKTAASGTNVVTTRYWDCCKPSCAWVGNTDVSTPIRSCAADGDTTIDGNTQSGCESDGSAYICNDQRPYVVNSTFAYGFIAAGFKSTDHDMCCACLQFTFKGDLAGKTMIVQVTNTGGSSSTNDTNGKDEFDIALPGGGVGYYTDGCTKQWKTSSDVWGQQYGGVESENACNNLPAKLQEGCKFRWTWMDGYSNPTVDFKEVNCPKELTDISKCVPKGL